MYATKNIFYDSLHDEDEDIEGLCYISDCDYENNACYEESIENSDFDEKYVDLDLQLSGSCNFNGDQEEEAAKNVEEEATLLDNEKITPQSSVEYNEDTIDETNFVHLKMAFNFFLNPLYDEKIEKN